MRIGAKSRLKLTALLAAALFAGLTCTETTGLRSGKAVIGVAPVFSPRAAAIYSNVVSAGLSINNVHLLLDRGDGSHAVDTTVTLTPGQDSVVIEMQVDVSGGQELLKATIDLRDGTVVLFSGTQNVLAIAGGAPQGPPPSIKVDYAGPGANIASVSIAHDDTISTGDSVVYTPTAKDGQGANVTDFALLWSLKDSTIGTVSSSGVFKAGNKRGVTYVVARTFTGIRDSARVTVVPPMSKLVVISGSGQTGTVGKALPQPIIFEAQAADNLPVPRAAVTVVHVSGAATLSQTGPVTMDAAGRLSLTLTLGAAVGADTVQVSAAGVTAVKASAIAVADAPRKLVISQQPSATTVSAVPLATQPVVQLQDQFGNAAKVSGKPVVAALTTAAGRLLTGTLTRNTDSTGVATFTDLVVSGPSGTTTLTFTQDTLTAATSNTITIGVGAPAQVAIVAGEGLGALKGNEVSPAPKVRVTDAGTNNVAGAAVSFTISSGGGEANNGSTTFNTVTDASGLATTDWHLGTSGVQTLTVHVAGASDVIFHAFLAETLVIVAAPPLAPVTGAAMSQQPTLQLQDKAGHQVKASGVQVTAGVCCRDDTPLNVDASDATLSGTTTVATDANGTAQFADLQLNGVVNVTTKLAFSATSVDSVYSALLRLNGGAPAFIQNEVGDYVRLTDIGAQPIGARVRDALENVVSGAGVQFTVVSGACTVPAGVVTTDLSGLARTDATFAGPITSCVVRASVVGGGTPPSVIQRISVVPPDGSGHFNIWTGAVSDSWEDAGNWYDNVVPDGSMLVFVPAAAGPPGTTTAAYPKINSAEPEFAGGVATEAGAHIYLNGKELYATGGLYALGSIEGPGTVGVGTVTLLDVGLQGTVHALLELGDVGCESGNVYLVTGVLAADSLTLNCPMFVEEGTDVTVAGDMRTMPTDFGNAGGFLQEGSTITVGGNAYFDGIEEFAAGLMDLKGHLFVTGDCDFNGIIGESPHVFRMSGNSATDSLALNVNAPGCVGTPTFGKLEIATTGSKGVVIHPFDGAGIALDSILVRNGATLSMLAGTNVVINLSADTAGVGALDIETGGTLIVEPGANVQGLDLCGLLPVNHGPLHCDWALIPALRAPTSGGTKAGALKARIDALRTKATALRRTTTTTAGKRFKK